MKTRHSIPARARGCSWLAALLGVGASLVLLGACQHKRPHCPTCSEANPIANGCPFPPAASMLSPVGAVNVIFLSGGGSHGAWGAGVLHGWNEPPLSRPDFNLVTGISTGALQAPLVFLGMDAELEEVYTTTESQDVYTPKLFPLFSDSLQSRAPLKQLIDKYIDDDAVKQVASEGAKQRHLWLGTVNLDTSQFCSWDMVTIATRAETAETNGDTAKAQCYRDLFRDVVWAASGAPVLAPPVEIDGDFCETGGTKNGFFHVDGGTRLRVFAEKPLLDALKAARTQPGNPTAYVIMNGKMHMHPKCVDDRIIPIAERAVETLMQEAVYGNLYFLKHEMGPPSAWNLRLSYIDHTYPLYSAIDFQPSEMSKLYKAGRDWVRASLEPGAPPPPFPWEKDIPPDRVKPCPPGDASCQCSP